MWKNSLSIVLTSHMNTNLHETNTVPLSRFTMRKSMVNLLPEHLGCRICKANKKALVKPTFLFCWFASGTNVDWTQSWSLDPRWVKVLWFGVVLHRTSLFLGYFCCTVVISFHVFCCCTFSHGPVRLGRSIHPKHDWRLFVFHGSYAHVREKAVRVHPVGAHQVLVRARLLLIFVQDPFRFRSGPVQIHNETKHQFLTSSYFAAYSRNRNRKKKIIRRKCWRLTCFRRSWTRIWPYLWVFPPASVIPCVQCLPWWAVADVRFWQPDCSERTVVKRCTNQGIGTSVCKEAGSSVTHLPQFLLWHFPCLALRLRTAWVSECRSPTHHTKNQCSRFEIIFAGGSGLTLWHADWFPLTEDSAHFKAS